MFVFSFTSYIHVEEQICCHIRTWNGISSATKWDEWTLQFPSNFCFVLSSLNRFLTYMVGQSCTVSITVEIYPEFLSTPPLNQGIWQQADFKPHLLSSVDTDNNLFVFDGEFHQVFCWFPRSEQHVLERTSSSQVVVCHVVGVANFFVMSFFHSISTMTDWAVTSSRLLS